MILEIEDQSEVDKLKAFKGTLVMVCWPDVTSWCLAGWNLVESIGNKALLKKD